jgi:hypothetical protein
VIGASRVYGASRSAMPLAASGPSATCSATSRSPSASSRSRLRARRRAADQLDPVEQPRVEPDDRVAGRRDHEPRSFDADAAARQQARAVDRVRGDGFHGGGLH